MELMPAVRALHIAALALLAGGFGFPLLVLAPSAAAEPERSDLCRWLARLRLWGAGVALLTWVGWLALVAASMSGLALADALRPSVLRVVLEQTRFGHVWVIRFGLLLLLVRWLAWPRRRSSLPGRGAGTVGTTLAALVLVSQVWAGHATAGPPLHVAADALHLAAAALWVGSLPPLLLLLARARTGAPAWFSLAAAAARGFSGMGAFTVAALMITGYFNGQMALGSVHALATTRYGHLIAAKIVLFAAMLVLAAANRFRFTPRLDTGHAQARVAVRSLQRAVATELALGACILALVGALGGSEPPAHDASLGLPMQHRMDMSR